MMANRARRVWAALVLLSLSVTACSTGDDVAEKGQVASEVCGGFAAEPAAASALEAIAGKGVLLTSDQSEPDRGLGELRKATETPQSGKSFMKGVPFCVLEAAPGEQNILTITVREALAVPSDDAGKEFVTFYSSGLLASSSDLHASIYFMCRMKEPAHGIVIEAGLERADENEADRVGIREGQITLANAAARHVAAALGCTGTGLVERVPAEVPRS
ncbi:hypothetical protein [Streptomyces sp. NPDC058872]|uniref:hypothetical protein n=1 Tax=Streptomyces sp. NPDC058872 TaxID=3346661 RepID=UPI0036905467